MEGLGLTPTMGSGSGTLEKEDGYSDNVLCQLKSTESRSLTVHVEDVEKLAYHAAVEHKAPVFALNFEGTVGVWLMVRPKDIERLDLRPRTGAHMGVGNHSIPIASRCEARPYGRCDVRDENSSERPSVGTSASSRSTYWEEREREREKGNERRAN